MSVYLCVFESGKERASVEVGPYSYFGAVRDLIATVAGGQARFPKFLLHADSQGSWNVDSLEELEAELLGIRTALLALSPELIVEDDWYIRLAVRTKRDTLNASLLDVDGSPLIDRLLELVRYAKSVQEPILFQ